MTNEKTNPLPYRAAAETGLPEMREPVITPDDVARGTELLRRYKDGKRALEARIIADEQWYRLRHWQYLRDRRREQGADVVEPTSAWLFNAHRLEARRRDGQLPGGGDPAAQRAR